MEDRLPFPAEYRPPGRFRALCPRCGTHGDFTLHGEGFIESTCGSCGYREAHRPNAAVVIADLLGR